MTSLELRLRERIDVLTDQRDQARAERDEARRRLAAAIAGAYPPSERVDAAGHGTESRYKRGCRCDSCRSASAAGRRARKWANIEATRAYDRERTRRQATA